MRKITFALALLCPFAALSQGFQLNLQGTKQIAMGGAGVSTSLDASSVFYNPGAIASMANQMLVNTSPILPRFSYADNSSGYTADAEKKTLFPFSGYGIFGMKDSKLKFGLGVYTPFGSAVNWGSTWKGQNVLRNITLQSVSVQPTVAYQVTPKIGIGAGFVYTYGTVDLSKSIPLAFNDGTGSSVNLKGNGNGYSFNAGVMYKPTDKLSVGVSYRSAIRIKVEGGDAKFTVPTSTRAGFQDTKFNAALPLPQNIALGLSYKVTDKFLVTAEFNYVVWSTYDTLGFNYDINSSNTAGSRVANTRAPRMYKDAFSVRAGSRYDVTTKIALMAGVGYANTPIQDGYLNPDVPDANRITASCGVSYKATSHIHVDAAFLYENLMKRTGTDNYDGFGGTYKTVAYIPSLSLGYIF